MSFETKKGFDPAGAPTRMMAAVKQLGSGAVNLVTFPFRDVAFAMPNWLNMMIGVFVVYAFIVLIWGFIKGGIYSTLGIKSGYGIDLGENRGVGPHLSGVQKFNSIPSDILRKMIV